MRSILITGIAGAGKSTLSSRASKALGLPNWDYADLMLKVASDIHNKDDLRKLTPDRRDAIYRQVEVLLAELFEPGDGRDDHVLLENHLSIVEGNRIRTFPHTDYHRYNPTALVVIEADAPDILRRRGGDNTRKRHIGSTDEITAQQDCNRLEATMIAHHLGISTTVIANDSLEESTELMVAWLHQLGL